MIERFMDFYLHRIALFNNSQHILDDETEVEQALSACGLHSMGRPITNYRFVNSKTEPGIQVSDVVAGIMGKLFNYVIRNPAEQIRKDISSANPRQARNLRSLRGLVDGANSVSPAFAHTIMSLEDRERAYPSG